MVLTILAILAALLIPALTGYIRKAKEKAIITEATDAWKAAQAAMSECYAMYPESFVNPDPTKPPCRFSTEIDGTRINNLGRITNAALNAVQKNPNDKTEINTSSRRIARQVLSYLDSTDKSNARYLFTAPSGKNTWNATFNVMLILEKNMILMPYCFRFSIQQTEKLLQLTLAKTVIW